MTRSLPRALSGLSCAMLLAALGTSIANIALPALARDFGASFSAVQAVVTAYLVTLTMFTPIVGRLGDRLGHRRVLILGLTVFALGGAVGSCATALWVLVGARVLQGVGAACMMTLTMALVRDTVTAERIGRAMGLLGTISAVGTALGPVLGGLLIGYIGWRAVFAVLAVLGIGATLLVRYTLSANTVSTSKVPERQGTYLTWPLLIGCTANLLVASLMMATLVVGPFYLSGALGLQAAGIGMVMAIGPVISICTGLPSGRLVDAYGALPVRSSGLTAALIGALALAVLPPVIGLMGYILGIAVLTPGYQLFQSANNTVIMASASTSDRGAVSGMLGLSRNLGLILGASVMGVIFAQGASDLTEASRTMLDNGLHTTFGLGAILMLVALGLTRARD